MILLYISAFPDFFGENCVSSVYSFWNLAMYKSSGNVVALWDFICWFLSQDLDSWAQMIECLTTALVLF